MGRRSVGVSLMKGRCSIYTHRRPTITDTSLKSARCIVSGHIPRATHDIIDMLAPLRRHRTRITSAETEFGSRHEVRPLMNLLKLPESRRKDKPSDRIAISIRTVRIKLTSRVTGRDVETS